MALWDRLRRAERATDERTVLLTCRDNGEKLRVPEDAGSPQPCLLHSTSKS